MPGSTDASSRPNIIDEPIQSVAGIGEKRAESLARLGIHSVRDLVFHFPRTYEDRRTIDSISDLCEGESTTICAEIVKAEAIRLRGRMGLARIVLRDSTGTLNAVWFGQTYLARVFQPGARAIFSGVVGKWKGLCLRNPDYEILSNDDQDLLHTGRIVPIYRTTEGVSQRVMRKWIADALAAVQNALAETLVEPVRLRYKFPPIGEAMQQVHFPDDLESPRQARNRFAYEELLEIQLQLARTRSERIASGGIQHETAGEYLGALADSLPFELTEGQTRARDDMLKDMHTPSPAARLLQGDVGCGKTAVALHAIAAAADGGYQSALMAPTEILAEQHAATLREYLEPIGLRVACLTSSVKGMADLRDAIAQGLIHTVVGTHALIQDRVTFAALGLVIVDEQHRFGVLQRDRLVSKGANPDLLHMTATPIPRTLAQTVYGAMDLTIIEELPPGRRPVKTKRVTPAKLPKLYDHICSEAENGFQTFVVCPLVEDSDKRDDTSATRRFEELKSGPLESLRLALLHGRMASDEKERIIRAFKNGETDVLVSTTVIEVGVDCPNATTIIIEDAGRFGLPQLHQLRGRVGRNDQPAYCFLLGKIGTKDSKRRLDVMCETTSGFDIAEADLDIRGPGEFFGVRQAGLSDLRIADLVRDARLIDHARRDAEAILQAENQPANPVAKTTPLSKAS